MNGADGWTEKAIAGRGVLLDFESYATESGLKYDPMTGHPITVSDMTTILEKTGIKSRPGDILFIRTGKRI